MGTKRNPGRFDCYERADTDEPMFILLGRDRHASALVNLWAEMREKENEDPAVVEEARKVAADLATWAQSKAKPVMTLRAVANLLASTYSSRGLGPQPPRAPARPSFRPGVGEYVVPTKGGTIGVVTAVFTEDQLPKDKETGEVQHQHLLDCVNVQYGRAAGSVTVALSQLRAPTQDEMDRAGY
jgi:hypothetical protein